MGLKSFQKERWLPLPNLYYALMHFWWHSFTDVWFNRFNVAHIRIERRSSLITHRSPAWFGSDEEAGYHVAINTNLTFKEKATQIAKFMGPTWGPPGSCRPQMGPMLAPWTLLSGQLSELYLGAHNSGVALERDGSVNRHTISIKIHSCCFLSPSHQLDQCLIQHQPIRWY